MVGKKDDGLGRGGGRNILILSGIESEGEGDYGELKKRFGTLRQKIRGALEVQRRGGNS